MTGKVLDTATQAFILEVITWHREPACILCDEDSFPLKSYISLLASSPTPSSCWRCRTASVCSLVTHKVTSAGFKPSSYHDCLAKWSRPSRRRMPRAWRRTRTSACHVL